MGVTGSKPFALVFAVLCAGCAYSPVASMLREYEAQNSVAAFQICRNYSCAVRVDVSLNDEEWGRVRALFALAPARSARPTQMPSSQGASEERERIRQAVALIETLVGPKAGTQNDRAGAAIISFSREGQLDCIDEAYNTSIYLRLLAQDALLQWHTVGMPARRGSFFDSWPHNTATIVVRGSGARYTVDSWFGRNGALPDVVPLQVWLDGWHPPAGPPI